MNKRTLLLVVALVASVALVATGTLAYLTDTDGAVNVMTLGNVDIEQIELQRTDEYIKNYDGNTNQFDTRYNDLENFQQSKPLYPAYPVPGGNMYEPTYEKYWYNYLDPSLMYDDLGEAVDKLWRIDDLKGVQDKFVFVENTGNSPAYFRTILAFEAPEGITVGFDSTADIIINKTADDIYQWDELGYMEVEGTRYWVWAATYQEELAPGKIARPSLLQVVMHDSCGNEDVALLDGTYEILALSQAVQVENLEELGITGALDAAFGEINEDSNVIEWLANLNGLPVTTVTDADELRAALANGETVVLSNDIEADASESNGYAATGILVPLGGSIIGNGNDLAVPGANTTWASALAIRSGTIDGLNIVEGFRGIFVLPIPDGAESQPVILNNVTVDGPTYTISCDSASGQGLIATGCTFNGWTSYAGAIGDVSFTNCSFGEGAGYAGCRPYAPTVFTNCSFEAGFEIDAVAEIVLVNCTLDGVLVDNSNLATLVTSNTANASIG